MKIIQWMTNWFYERDMLIISPSHLIKKTLEEQGVRTPIEVVSNGMDLAVFKGGIKLAPSADPRLLHVGRISFEKNCDVVLRSFALVLRDFPSATLDIVGDGPALQSLRILARDLGIERVVRFHGFIARDRLPRMYTQYDLFVTASTMETQGLVVLEAVASGLPCVGVDAYALPELIHHGENGYIARPFDHEEMGRYVVSLLKNRALYRTFSKRSLQIASGHEIHRCAMKLERVYESCLRLEAVA
jgi:glycosyltransferase involved in cell wall biosynthesis